MQILIVGQPKTGTSALFFKVKNSFQGECVSLFEPSPDDILSFDPAETPPETLVLAKALLLNDPSHRHEYLHRFERVIFLTRDPRDRLISALLYSVRDSTYFDDDSKVARLLFALENKEKDPKSVPLADLWELCIELNDRTSYSQWIANLAGSLDFVIRFHAATPSLFTLKYEDLIDGRLERLEDYLGMKLIGEARVSGEYARVERTKSYGNWRSWFVESDVQLFRPAYRAYMDTFGYRDEWTLSSPPIVLPEHASGYVRRLVNQRRHECQKPSLPA